MPPEQEIPTSAGMETATQTVDRIQSALQPTISAKDLATPTEPVNPPMGVQPEPSNRVGSLIGNVTRDTQGFITNQSEEAQRAREIAGEMASLSGQGAGDVRSSLNEQYQIPENLQTLQDIQLQLADRGEQSALTQSRIAGKAGQTINEGGRAITQEQKEAAIRDAGLAARASVLQGNIETASTLVSQAVQDFNADRTFKNNQMINQLNYFQGLADEQTSQLLEQEKRKYQEDQAAIERVQTAVDAAMSSGAATQQDITQLTDPRLTDEERLAVAQGVVARGNTEMRNLDMEAQRASIRASDALTQQRAIDTLISRAEAGDQDAIAELGITMPDDTMPSSDEIAYARQYASTGTIPAGLSSAGVDFGSIAELAGDLPKPEGALVDINTNVASAGVSATDQTSFDALYNAINTDLPAIRAAWDEINQSNSFADNAEAMARGEQPSDPSFGTGILGGIQSKINPTEAMTRYETAVADFTAKLVLARSGAAATDAEVARYQALLPGLFNTPAGIGTPGEQKLSALETQMGSALNDKLATNGLAIHGFSRVNLGGEDYVVGEVVTNEYGQRGRVNPDGTITALTN